MRTRDYYKTCKTCTTKRGYERRSTKRRKPTLGAGPRKQKLKYKRIKLLVDRNSNALIKDTKWQNEFFLSKNIFNFRSCKDNTATSCGTQERRTEKWPSMTIRVPVFIECATK